MQASQKIVIQIFTGGPFILTIRTGILNPLYYLQKLQKKIQFSLHIEEKIQFSLHIEEKIQISLHKEDTLIQDRGKVFLDQVEKAICIIVYLLLLFQILDPLESYFLILRTFSMTFILHRNGASSEISKGSKFHSFLFSRPNTFISTYPLPLTINSCSTNFLKTVFTYLPN